MTFLILAGLYLAIGIAFYWCSTLEDDDFAIALIVMLVWPLFLLHVAVSVHSGKATVKRGGKSLTLPQVLMVVKSLPVGHGSNVRDLLVETGLATSKTDARRVINSCWSSRPLPGGWRLIRKGKRHWMAVQTPTLEW